MIYANYKKYSKQPCYLSWLPFIRNIIIHKIHLLKPNNEYTKKLLQNNIPLLVNNTLNNILEEIQTHSCILLSKANYLESTVAAFMVPLYGFYMDQQSTIYVLHGVKH